MKRKFSRIFSIIFILLVALLIKCNSVDAATYSGKNYEITIPNGYKVDKFEDELQAETYNGRNAVSLTVNFNDAFIVMNQAYLNSLIDSLKNEFGSDFKLISSKVIETNGCKGVEVQFRDTERGIYIYADAYSIKSDNYLYNLIFMSYDMSYLSSSEKNQIFNSFKIKDTVKDSNQIPFTDVAKNTWYYGAVKYAYDNNIMSGTNAYTFAPNDKLTRGMLVTLLYRMEGSPKVSGNSKFSDVQNSSAFYYTAIKWATQNNVINGYKDGRFGPNDAITREQLAVILSNYSAYKGTYKTQPNNLSKFKDSSKISAYAKPGMQWATGVGVITGSQGNLNPRGTTTRAEGASMLYKYCLNVK